jgi:hypothetical protein
MLRLITERGVIQFNANAVQSVVTVQLQVVLQEHRGEQNVTGLFQPKSLQKLKLCRMHFDERRSIRDLVPSVRPALTELPRSLSAEAELHLCLMRKADSLTINRPDRNEIVG